MLFENAPREKNKQVTLTFPQSLIDEVDKRSASLNLSKSAYVRLAVRDYFRKEDNRQK